MAFVGNGASLAAASVTKTLIDQIRLRARTGGIEAARPLLRSAVTNNPRNPDLLLRWAAFEIEAGHMDEARQALDQALDSGASGIMPFQLQVALFTNAGDIAAVRKLCDNAVAQTDDIELTLLAASTLLAVTRDAVRASQVLTELGQAHPQRADVQELLVYALDATGNALDVEKISQAVLHRGVESAVVRLYLVRARCQLGNLEGAFEAAQRLVNDAEPNVAAIAVVVLLGRLVGCDDTDALEQHYRISCETAGVSTDVALASVAQWLGLHPFENKEMSQWQE